MAVSILMSILLPPKDNVTTVFLSTVNTFTTTSPNVTTITNISNTAPRLLRGAEGHDPDLTFQQNLQRYAYGYVMLAVCVCGILGNALALAVLSTKSLRSSNTAAYLRCLAAADTAVLVLAIFRYRSYYVLLSEQQVIHMVVFFDKYVQVYLVPFFWVFLGASSFITLSLSLERYLVIRWPFSVKKPCRVGTVRGCTALAILGVVLVTLPHFLCYRVQRTQFRGLQVAMVVLDERHLAAREYLETFNYYVLPIVWYMIPWALMSVVNILLAVQVRKSSRIRVSVPNSLNPNRSLSMLIILIVGVYMVCHFPRCILAMFCLVNDCTTSNDSGDISARTLTLVKATAEVLNILNSCLNIVVYCVTGTLFRRQLKQLLLCRCCKSSVAPPTHQSVHVSLREVPATPLNSRASFNMSYRELQLTLSHARLQPSPDASNASNASTGDLRPLTPSQLQPSTGSSDLQPLTPSQLQPSTGSSDLQPLTPSQLQPSTGSSDLQPLTPSQLQSMMTCNARLQFSPDSSAGDLTPLTPYPSVSDQLKRYPGRYVELGTSVPVNVYQQPIASLPVDIDLIPVTSVSVLRVNVAPQPVTSVPMNVDQQPVRSVPVSADHQTATPLFSPKTSNPVTDDYQGSPESFDQPVTSLFSPKTSNPVTDDYQG